MGCGREVQDAVWGILQALFLEMGVLRQDGAEGARAETLSKDMQV